MHSVFTTHTPVPAGHDVFSEEQIDDVVGSQWDEFGIDRDTFHAMGHHPELDHGRFHMTALAIRLSRHVNGVSRIHGEVTRGLWTALWPGREPAALPIGHITNGVHLGSWMSHRVMELFDDHFGADWERRVDEPGFWDRVGELDDDALWGVHLKMKYALLNFVRGGDLADLLLVVFHLLAVVGGLAFVNSTLLPQTFNLGLERVDVGLASAVLFMELAHPIGHSC